MAYTDFTHENLSLRLGVRLVEVHDLFAAVPPAPVGDVLTAYLRENAWLALEMSTEKARSEMIIAPILLEARRQRSGEVSLFSGMEFTVDVGRGLNGYCDFLFSLSPTQIAIEAPVIAIVEAKNENIRLGIPQCVAEMCAARLFNERREQDLPDIFGAVTTGSVWRFLRLREDRVELDRAEYHHREVERIVGVLLSMLSGETAEPASGFRVVVRPSRLGRAAPDEPVKEVFASLTMARVLARLAELTSLQILERAVGVTLPGGERPLIARSSEEFGRRSNGTLVSDHRIGEYPLYVNTNLSNPDKREALRRIVEAMELSPGVIDFP